MSTGDRAKIIAAVYDIGGINLLFISILLSGTIAWVAGALAIGMIVIGVVLRIMVQWVERSYK